MKKKIIIIGGGFGGLEAAKYLKNFDGEVTLIDKMNHHLFQPLLYQVATAALSPGNIAMPLREILKHQKNISILLGEVEHIYPDKKEILLADGKRLSFDFLIVATGSKHSYFNHPEWESSALGLKTLTDALNIRNRLLLSFEIAEQIEDPRERAPYLSFVVVGGGPTGVEMAGSIVEILKSHFFNTFHHLSSYQSKIYLVEGEKNVLGSYPESLCKYTKETLEKMGVTVLLNTLVTDVQKESVTLKDPEKTFTISSKNIIWAAGNKVSPLLQDLNTPLDNSGRVIVEADLTIPNNSSIFVIGDAAHIEKNNKLLPGIAPVAIQSGAFVAKEILRKTKNLSCCSPCCCSKEKKIFNYFDKGSLATIGRGKAVGIFKNIAFKGFFAWFIWTAVHIFYLISFRNKVSVMLNWTYLYFTGARTARLIQEEVKNPFTFKIP